MPKLTDILEDIPELDDPPNIPREPVERVIWVDRLSEMFRLQAEFMAMLLDRGKLPLYPLDLTTKDGQGWINRTVWDSVRELAEAAQHLKNKLHRSTDDRSFDRAAYLEELADAHAFFLEALIMSGVSHEEFYEAFVSKNAVVRKRLLEGY